MDSKKLLIGLFVILSLTACSSTNNLTTPIEPLASSEVCCDDFSQFPWIQLGTTEDLDFQLDASSPIGRFSDGNSHFNAFKLSERSQKVQLRLASLMLNNSVVAPKLIALDDKFNIVSTASFDQFDIKTSDAFTQTQFQLSFDLDASKTPYFIIYSSDAYLGQSIKVKHPARIRAEELGEPMPMVTDPSYSYQRFGQLKLSVKTLSLQAYKASVKQIQPVIKSVQPETQQFYQNAITQAVNANDISKALSLIEEAKALGIINPERVFINALEKINTK
jgi:maltose operon protein